MSHDEFGSLFDNIEDPAFETDAEEWGFGSDLSYQWSPGLVFAGPNSPLPDYLADLPAVTAMPVGPPPDGIQYLIAGSPSSYSVMGAILDGEIIGYLTWGLQGRQIQSVWVKAEHRRRRVAEQMLVRAQGFDPQIRHHSDRTESGDEWARAMDSGAPKRSHIPDDDDDGKNKALVLRRLTEPSRRRVWDVTSGIPIQTAATRSELRDTPEAALPSVTADDEDEWGLEATALSPAQHTAAVALLAAVDAGQSPVLLPPSADEREFADAARAHLAKSAVRRFSKDERDEIINEGASVQAGNLDRLDITGTHYEALASRAVPDDEDLTFLSGDPNLPDF